jgi:hypothetical protein
LGRGGRELKNKAMAYIEAAAGSADVTALAAENSSLREQMADLQAQMTALRNGVSVSASASQEQTDDPNVYATAEEPDIEIAPDASTDFDTWDDDKLKDYIAQHTGSRPRGNPSHNTLAAAAAELAAG